MRNILLLSLMALGLGLTACTKKQSNDLEYGLKLNETLRINLQTEPPTLDWSKSTDTTSAEVQFNIMSALVEYDLNDPELKLIPSLATKWEASNNATKWKLTLRQGAKWTDGVEFEAKHVLDGWERLLNPATASEYAYFLFAVKGAKDYNTGKLKDFSQVGVRAINKYEIEVDLVQSMSFFPKLLTHHSTFPIRSDVIAKHGDKWTEPGNIVTIGPFTLKVWDHDKALVLERYEGYWGEKPKVKNVLAYIINDQSTAINLFDSGKVDFLPELPSTELKVLRQRPEYREEGTLVIYYYGFNTQKPPFDNMKLRLAFAHAVDREQITKMIDGGQQPISGWVPKGMLAYEPDVGTKFDPSKAKQFLKEAGYEDPKKLGKVVIGFNTNENHKRIAENVQAQLKANLGVDVELKNEEWKVYLSTLSANPPNLFRLGWQADYPDPDNFLNLMTSESEQNRGKWKNKNFDSIVSKAAAELDDSKRKDLYREAQRLMLGEEAAAIPIYSGVSHYLISKRVDNFPVNPLGRRIYDKVSIKQ